MRVNLLSLVALASRTMPVSLKKWVYQNEPLASLTRRALNKAAPSGLTDIKVAAGGIVGLTMCLDLQREKYYWLGTYETDLQAAVADLVQPGWVAYDVGANVGYVSMLLARTVGKKGAVFSFEALPENVNRLRTHVHINDFGSTIVVVPSAVSSVAGMVEFFIGPNGAMGKLRGSAGHTSGYEEVISVPGVSIDSFIFSDGNPPPQVIKVDIEGGEVLALRGMRRVLQEARPLILLELHGPEAARVTWDVLADAGYSLHRMIPEYPRICSVEELDWKAYLVAKP